MGNLVAPDAVSRAGAWLVSMLVPRADRDAVRGDLVEQYAERVRRDGRVEARLWYRAQVLRSILPLLVFRIRQAVSVSAFPVVVLSAFAIASSMQNILTHLAVYRHLYRTHPFYVPEFFKNTLAVGVCLLALLLRAPFRRFLSELRLRAAVVPAIAFALVLSAPMLLGIVLTRGFQPPAFITLVFLTVFSPFTEEVISRGFVVGQLYYRARWPLWSAVLVSAVVTGVVHIEKGTSPGEMLGLFLLTGTGGAVFAWLMVEFNSLWVPIALHASMNLWWELFRVSRTALGDWYAFALQTATVLFAILLTIIIKRYYPDVLQRFRQPDSPGRETPQPATVSRIMRTEHVQSRVPA